MSAERAFIKALKAANLHSVDKSTGISSIHIHMLRKYFLSQIKLKIPYEMAEALAGHTTYLSTAYRRYSRQQFAEYYLKGESALLILQDSQRLDQLNDEVDKRDKQLQDLVVYNQSLLAKNDALQVRLRQLETRTTTLESCVKNLPQLLGLEGKIGEISILDSATIELTPAKARTKSQN
jgi:hypothetical protein